MVLDPSKYGERLLIQFRDDPCRDECNTDDTCQNYSAPPASCSAEEEEEEPAETEDDAEEVSVEEDEEAANETEESETLNISTAPAMSDILLISGTTGISIGMVAYLLLKA